MRRFFSKSLVLFFFLALLFLVKSQAFATAQITVDPYFSLEPSTDQAREYVFGNIYGNIPTTERAIVTENTKTVHITFSGLTGKNYTACLSTKCLLLANPSGTKTMAEFNINTLDGANLDTSKQPNADGDLPLSVCADGEESLKLAENTNGTECGDQDYFHSGHIYGVVIYNDDGIADTTAFYVSRYYPFVLVTSQVSGYQLIKPGEKINVFIKGTRLPNGDNYDANNNNYAVEIAGADDPSTIFEQECVTVPKGVNGSNDGSITVPLAGRPEGDYIIKINEQEHEKKGFFHINPNFHQSACAGAFTYYWIKIRVRNDKFWKDNCQIDKINSGSCLLNSTIEIIPDPDGTDVPGEKKSKPAPPPPCAISNWDPLLFDTCPTLKTAVGNIDTSPQAFIGSVLGLVLGISGGIALLLIIYGGYQLMVSRGKPESLEAARDQITAAIIGLLFIIFALVILQVIGFNILHIPSFGGSDSSTSGSVPSSNLPVGTQKSLFQ